MKRLSWPAGFERLWVGAAACTWAGAAGAGRLSTGGMAAALVGGGLIVSLSWRRHRVVAFGAIVALIGLVAAWNAASGRAVDATGLGGHRTLVVDLSSDPRPGSHGAWALARPLAIQAADGSLVPWQGPPGLVSAADWPEAAVGARFEIEGLVVARAGRAGGDLYAWRMRPDHMERIPAAVPWLLRAADAIRGRISTSLDGSASPSAAALVSGFLIGDVRALAPVDAEAMRGAGLSHFVAVSGSNVALFLLLWWFVVAPLAVGPLGRAVGGLVGLALFGTVTRWEPSVVRAAAMAGGVLVGRAAGVPITPWSALGAATTLVLVVEPGFSGDVGFQLSVAATAGVLAGARMLDGFGPRWVTMPLGVTLAAQAAVAPILLMIFGEVPLWSPLANLVAAPLVTAATTLGALGAVGVGPATDLAVAIARLVLRIAHAVAGLPTLGWSGLTAAAAAAGLATRFPRLRSPLVLGAAVILGVGVLPGRTIAGPAMVALDVGQGDAVLLVGDRGGVVLVDGGSDPIVIADALARHGVRRVDLAVATHPDEDHIGGIIEVVRRMPVGEVWRPHLRGDHPRIADLDAAAALAGVPAAAPGVGDVVDVGGVVLEVLGPLRRYAGVNDESIVVVATVGDLSVFLTADTEATAQREIGMPSVDVVKVPHHGSRTTDLAWLATTDAAVAVISVGENDFGHPAPEVVAVLDGLGIEVRRTDLEGDVVLR